MHISLAGGLDPVLAGMKQKWRYNVRLSARKGVVVRRGTEDDLSTFQALMAETGQRDDFGVHEAAYYRAAFELFAGDDTARWLLAEFDGQPLAAIVVFALGSKSWYMWGASSSRERRLMPNHALQWAAMQWAHERGCQTYDLWGIPDEVGTDPSGQAVDQSDRTGGLWGVYRFKQGFGGHVVRYTTARDLVISPAGYRLYNSLRRLQR
jgi:lipid II:glycine glycyltransferase (peptidoglycan interpeptide bridge formation enzyme)